ncbi:MAG: hypothetical protein H6Q25_606 [Bacteroidetes bacterium]|nr:hypothetical protein [Bacteroidota bacterium]
MATLMQRNKKNISILFQKVSFYPLKSIFGHQNLLKMEAEVGFKNARFLTLNANS